MVKFGCCLPGASFVPQAGDDKRKTTDPLQQLNNNLAMLSNHGYDFAEMTVGMLVGLSEEDFEQWVQAIQTSGITVPVVNSFIPKSIRLTGPDVSRDAIDDYLKIAFSRVKAVGGKVIIFGSGGARNVPDEFDRADAYLQLKDFLRMCNDYGSQYGITVAIEPLNRKESNVINLVSEGLQLAKELNLPHIQVLADSYHMLEEGENLSVLSEAVASGLLAHVHIADRNRVFPGLPAENGMDFSRFFEQLHKAGYEGRISAECRFDDFAVNSKRSLDYVNGIWNSLN